jgi:hypothetical protein
MVLAGCGRAASACGDPSSFSFDVDSAPAVVSLSSSSSSVVSKSIMTGPIPSSASVQYMLAFATTFDVWIERVGYRRTQSPLYLPIQQSRFRLQLHTQCHPRLQSPCRHRPPNHRLLLVRKLGFVVRQKILTGQEEESSSCL